jgi:hypothetical protein
MPLPIKRETSSNDWARRPAVGVDANQRVVRDASGRAEGFGPRGAPLPLPHKPRSPYYCKCARAAKFLIFATSAGAGIAVGDKLTVLP